MKLDNRGDRGQVFPGADYMAAVSIDAEGAAIFLETAHGRAARLEETRMHT